MSKKIRAYDADTRTYSRTGVYRVLGMSWNGFLAAEQRGWLTFDRRGRMRAATLRRFVESPLCWLIAPPERITDPLLRAYATTARGQMWRHRWYCAADLAPHYHVHPSIPAKWRRTQAWPSPDAWVSWAGCWWIWLDTMPPPPTFTTAPYSDQHRESIRQSRIRVGDAVRARIVAAITARGGLPPKGHGRREAFLTDVARDVGLSIASVRAHLKHMRSNEMSLCAPSA